MAKTKEYSKNIRDWKESDRARLLSEFLDNARTGNPTIEDMAAEYGVSTNEVLDWKEQTLNGVDSKLKDPLLDVVKQADEDLKNKENKRLDARTKSINKVIRNVVIAAVAVLVAVNGGRMVVKKLTSPKEFNPYSYIDVKYTGISGYGSAEATFNSKKASKDLGQTISKDDVVVTVDDNHTLKNGDQVTIQVKDTKDLNEKKLTASPKKRDYTVVGLINGSPVDAFKDVDVKFNGIDGKGTVTVTNNSKDNLLQSAEYSVDKDSGLKNGDKVTVKVKVDPDVAISTEKYPSETEKEYTVDSLGKYIKQVNDVSSAGWKQIDGVASKQITSDLMAQSAQSLNLTLGMNSSGLAFYNEADITKKITGTQLVRAYIVSGRNLNDTTDDVGSKVKMNANNEVFLMYRVTAQMTGPSNETGIDNLNINNGTGNYIWISYQDLISDSKGDIDTKSMKKVSDGYTDDRAYVDLESMSQKVVNDYRDAGYTVVQKDF